MSATLYQTVDNKEFATVENHMMVKFADASRIQSELSAAGQSMSLRVRPLANNERFVKSADEIGDWYQLVDGLNFIYDVAVLLAIQSPGPGTWDVSSGIPQWKLTFNKPAPDPGPDSSHDSGPLGDALNKAGKGYSTGEIKILAELHDLRLALGK